ncbi:MAG: RDD family protein [Chloracidobacterium sp.]|nr:RDD family protein [Chloracidobacterium sp.]MDW8218779.1 RDD family protein [Acidobacteriota bacterium]
MSWRVVVQGQTYETNLEELQQWVREGRILPDDQVFQPGVGWCAAGQLPELQRWFPPGVLTPLPPSAFGIAPPPSSSAALPYAPPTLPPSLNPTPYAPLSDPYAPAYGQIGVYPPALTVPLGVPAGVGKRFLGALVDSFLAFLCALPGLFIYLSAVLASDHGEAPGGRAAGGYLLIYFGAFAYSLLCAYLTSRSGGSPGKKLLGMVVLREDGQYLSFGMALLREVLKNVFSNICFLLNAWLLVDPQRQQLYDKVVRANVYEAS